MLGFPGAIPGILRDSYPHSSRDKQTPPSLARIIDQAGFFMIPEGMVSAVSA